MSEFHYVRTLGPTGGVDMCEGPAIGVDLETVLKDGLPPWKIALEIVAALCEILDIADQDGEIHGDVQAKYVFLDETGAVSLEEFGVQRKKTRAPEGTPRDTRTDLYGLGHIALRCFTTRPMPPGLPEEPDAHDDAIIDLCLGIDLSELDEAMQGDVQWFIAKLMSFDREDRPAAVDAWRTFVAFAAAMPGPDMAEWCAKALDGGGERRAEAAPAQRAPPSLAPAGPGDDENLQGPAVQKGFFQGRPINFEDASAAAAKGGATAFWTREDMKRALEAQKVEATEDGPPAGVGGAAASSFWKKEQLDAMARGDANAPRPKRAEGEGERRKNTAAHSLMMERRPGPSVLDDSFEGPIGGPPPTLAPTPGAPEPPPKAPARPEPSPNRPVAPAVVPPAAPPKAPPPAPKQATPQPAPPRAPPPEPPLPPRVPKMATPEPASARSGGPRTPPTPPPGLVTAQPGRDDAPPDRDAETVLSDPSAWGGPPAPQAPPRPLPAPAPAPLAPASPAPTPAPPPAPADEGGGGLFYVVFGGSMVALVVGVVAVVAVVLVLGLLLWSWSGPTPIPPPPDPVQLAPTPVVPGPPPAPVNTDPSDPADPAAPDPATPDPATPDPATPDPAAPGPGAPDPQPTRPSPGPRPQQPQPQPQPVGPKPPKPPPPPPPPRPSPRPTPQPGGTSGPVKVSLRSSGRGTIRNCTESSVAFDGMRSFTVEGFRLPAVCLVEIDGAKGVFTVLASGDIACDKQGTAVVCDKASIGTR